MFDLVVERDRTLQTGVYVCICTQQQVSAIRRPLPPDTQLKEGDIEVILFFYLFTLNLLRQLQILPLTICGASMENLAKCVSGGTRTHNLRIRSPTRYPLRHRDMWWQTACHIAGRITCREEQVYDRKKSAWQNDVHGQDGNPSHIF